MKRALLSIFFLFLIIQNSYAQDLSKKYLQDLDLAQHLVDKQLADTQDLLDNQEIISLPEEQIASTELGEIEIFQTLPTEICRYIFLDVINEYIEDFKIDRDFKKIDKELKNFRLVSKPFKAVLDSVISIKFLDNLTKELNFTKELKITDSPVSRVALAHAILSHEEFNLWQTQVNKQDCDNLGLEILNAILTFHPPLVSPFDNIKNLISQANLNFRNQDGLTPLGAATNRGELALAQLLIKAGASKYNFLINYWKKTCQN